MPAPTPDVIVEQLQQLVQTQEKRLATLKEDIQVAEAELARTRSALRELTGRAAKPKPKSTKSKAGKPAPTRAIVVETAEAVLSEKGVLAEDKLKAFVEQLLVNGGYTKNGFALRFREALADERFVDSPAGYRLAVVDSPAANNSRPAAVSVE